MSCCHGEYYDDNLISTIWARPCNLVYVTRSDDERLDDMMMCLQEVQLQRAANADGEVRVLGPVKLSSFLEASLTAQRALTRRPQQRQQQQQRGSRASSSSVAAADQQRLIAGSSSSSSGGDADGAAAVAGQDHGGANGDQQVDATAAAATAEVGALCLNDGPEQPQE